MINSDHALTLFIPLLSARSRRPLRECIQHRSLLDLSDASVMCRLFDGEETAERLAHHAAENLGAPPSDSSESDREKASENIIEEVKLQN